MRISISVFSIVVALLLLVPQAGSSQLVEFDFKGNGGFGLLPENQLLEVDSDAFGEETGGGLVYDTNTNVLSAEFSFENLTGGLFNSAGGLHLHNAGPEDPFNNTGSVEFFFNSGAKCVPIGAVEGTIDIDVTLSEEQEVELFNGQYYVNIHTDGFFTGELRANLVVSVLLGDVNGSGEVDLLDVQPFVELLTNGGFSLEADVNCDGDVNLLDVSPFVEILTN